MNADEQKTITLETLVDKPKAAPLDGHHRERGEHRHEQHHPVEGLRAVGERGPGHRPALGEGGEHPRLAVEQPLHQDPEPEGGQGQVEPRQPDGRHRHQGTDRHRDQPAEHEGEHPGHAVLDVELRERHRPDGGERGVAQGHLPGRADQQAKGQQHHDRDQGHGEERELGAHQVGHEGERDEHRDPGGEPHQGRRPVLQRGAGLGPRARHEAAPGQHQQHDEQHEERQRLREPGQPWRVQHVLLRDV
jgi:hypothetical protein